ncbi:hypothetical protein RhiXN_10161 [Rhizoctonia solani]|uniref:PRO41 protein n=1 Tax=Rhizoctonia solani TaxID=456999 RepID=A0A8H7LFY0_9AGAM|nr:uncharacterized protein RhiXN_10161 [Rhizoctonia solani]KAF8668554.1 PRO41 protein [Rhizoctonia solani]QRW23837.1 hypothetical protein RhiXN_10161 [Rhizoctonia solani]
MGAFIWHQWARYVSLTAGIYGIWAGFWGILFRKFFWDFIGGKLQAPAPGQPPFSGGMITAPSAAPFVTIIVTIPLLQIITIIMSLILVLLEWPLPVMKKLPIYRSLVFRAVWLLLLAFVSVLFYQGTNVAIYGLTAAIGYTRGQIKGEIMQEAKENRGNGEPTKA